MRDEERIDASDANGFAPMQTLATYKVKSLVGRKRNQKKSFSLSGS
jgi:hypothetical protein